MYNSDMTSFGVRAGILCTLITNGASAQHAGPPLKHFQHTAWAGENGPPLSGTHYLVRSPDGYLWLGSREGLMRFDGVRFTIIDSAVTPTLKTSVAGLFWPRIVDREGWIWVSRPDAGLVQYRNGEFRVVHEPEHDVGRLTRVDGAGQVWLFGLGTHLRVWRNGRAERPLLPPAVQDTSVNGVVADTGRGIWIGTETQGLWHVVGSHAERVPPLDSRQPAIRPLLQSHDGSVWGLGGNRSALHRLVRGRWLPVSIDPDGRRPVLARTVVEDSSHAVWIGTEGEGVLRWRNGAFEQFTTRDGLSDATVDDLIPGDGESMWIALASGALDQLRPAPFVTLDSSDGLPFAPYGFLEDESGSLWGTRSGDHSSVFELSGGLVDGTAGPIRVTRAALPTNDRYQVLQGARGGGVWLGPMHGGLMRYRRGTVTRWTERDGMPAKRFGLAVETRDGAVWLGTAPTGGFGRLRNGKFLPIELPGAPTAGISALAEDARGHLWVSVGSERFVYELVGDRVVRRLGRDSGMPGPISTLTLERGDTLWGIVGDSGVVRIAGGRAAFVRLPMLRRVLSLPAGLTASESDLWIVGAGLVRLSLASLHAVADGKAGSIVPRFFLKSDGIPSPRNSRSPNPSFRARDGRVWFSTPAGLSVVDPSQQFVDSNPPQLHVEELSSSGRVISRNGSMEVPPRPASVSIRYTAISLLAPERTHIQYRLEGADKTWIDAVGPRVATYTQLRPGTYIFRLRAWNVDGIPSAHDETLSFRVRSAWHETTLSRIGAVLLIALTGAGAAMGLQRLRARRSAEMMRSQFEATLAERTRVARELHDTLLGDMAGLAMQLSVGARRVGASGAASAATTELLSALSTQVQHSLVEARRAVTAMRTARDELPPLRAQLADAVHQTFAQTGIATDIEHAGHSRPYPATIEAEIVGIATEAMINSRKHAGCRTVTVTCIYAPRELVVRVRDDGQGFDPSQPAPTGHWGMIGMRERAASIGATLAVTTTSGQGTEVTLVLPRADSRRLWWTRFVPFKQV
jgi:signal transduction histidine kinase/ligand-binding sensor domain-containing protein